MRFPWLGRVLYWLLWPYRRLYIYGSTRPKVVVVYDGEILLIKGWISHQAWTFPGGGIAKDEPETEAATRELAEETSIIAKESDLLKMAVDVDDLVDHHAPIYVYHPNTRPKTRGNYEIMEVMWFPLNHLPQDAHPLVKRSVKSLLTSGSGNNG